MQKRPANCPDYQPVLVYFDEPEIAHLFAELVEAQGLQAEITDCIGPDDKETRIITESMLFERLPYWAQKNALVVTDTNREVKRAAVTLLRPLDEERIEQAFAKFLSSKN